jgi:hypothetical protein
MMKVYKRVMMLALAASLLPTAAFCDDKDTTVVIPATGHLPFKPSRNFTGPAEVVVSNFYGSGNATSPGLRFNNQQLGEGIVIAHSANSNSALILTAQPGTYTLTLTDREVTKQFFSTSAYWQQEPGTVYREDAAVYKFINRTDRLGFERDEKYAAEGYHHCDMAEDDHLYMPVTAKSMERITATLETTAAALDFIPWSELWGCPEVETTAISTVLSDRAGMVNAPSCYNLHGQRISQPQRGISIVNGKKYVKR